MSLIETNELPLSQTANPQRSKFSAWIKWKTIMSLKITIQHRRIYINSAYMNVPTITILVFDSYIHELQCRTLLLFLNPSQSWDKRRFTGFIITWTPAFFVITARMSITKWQFYHDALCTTPSLHSEVMKALNCSLHDMLHCSSPEWPIIIRRVGRQTLNHSLLARASILVKSLANKKITN